MRSVFWSAESENLPQRRALWSAESEALPQRKALWSAESEALPQRIALWSAESEANNDDKISISPTFVLNSDYELLLRSLRSLCSKYTFPKSHP